MDFADSELNELFMANRKHSGVKDSLNGDAVFKLLFHADADSYFELRLHERTLRTAAEPLHQTDLCLSSIFRPIQRKEASKCAQEVSFCVAV